jgi:hypothetical protein
MHRRYMGGKVKGTWRYEINPWAGITRDEPLWRGWLSDKGAA